MCVFSHNVVAPIWKETIRIPHIYSLSFLHFTRSYFLSRKRISRQRELANAVDHVAVKLTSLNNISWSNIPRSFFSRLFASQVFTGFTFISFSSPTYSHSTRRHATCDWRSGECQSAETNHRPAVLTTGALRSRLSLKYRRVQFGWFSVVQQFTYTNHHSVTYGLSSLLTPSCSTPSAFLSISYSEFPFCGLSASFGHQTPPSCPFFLSYSFASSASTSNEPRARLPNPIPPTLGSWGSNLRVVFFSLAIAISLFSFQQ